MKKTPDQILAEGIAAKERATQDTNNPRQQVAVDQQQVVVTEKFDPFQDVVDFHKKFKIEYDGPPRELPPDLQKFRNLRFHEEIREIRAAQDARQLAETLDGYVDLIYIILGTCHLHGWNFHEAWRRVHEANMRKVRANEKNPGKYGSPDDIAKPPGWIPPTMQDLVTI